MVGKKGIISRNSKNNQYKGRRKCLCIVGICKKNVSSLFIIENLFIHLHLIPVKTGEYLVKAEPSELITPDLILHILTKYRRFRTCPWSIELQKKAIMRTICSLNFQGHKNRNRYSIGKKIIALCHLDFLDFYSYTDRNILEDSY